jgi:molybdenum cofactor synthesis domain-containing protein
MSNTKTAGLIIVGNEILSGRTQDTNTKTIALRLNEIGVALREVRVIPDVIETIIETVRYFSRTYDYVFTTGGIGPTHDDKTAEAVAKAFETELFQHPDALSVLIKHYGGAEHMNDGRIKMTFVPRGASLIDNPVSSAPGFKIENVHVMAGVPKIMEGMLNNIIPTLEGGDIIHSRQITVEKPESAIAHILEFVENEFHCIEIGSYPKYNTGVGKPEVTIVLRGTDSVLLDAAFAKIGLLIG